MTLEELGKKVKLKYPQYKNISDIELGKSILEKYPQYESSLTDRKTGVVQGQKIYLDTGKPVNATLKKKQEVTPKEKKGFFQETAEDIKQTGEGLKTTYSDTQRKIKESLGASIEGEQSSTKGLLQSFGIGLGGVSRGIGDVVIGAAKTILPQDVETGIKEKVGEIATPIMESDTAQNIIQKYEGLTTQKKRDVDAILGTASFGLDIAGAGVFKRGASSAIETGKKTISSVGTGIDKTKKIISKSKESAEGVMQSGKELTERVPRAVKNIESKVKESKIRAEKIRTSSPEIVEAIKTELPNNFIEGIQSADIPTLKSIKETIKIADKKTFGFKQKVQPSFVSGELAVKQFDVIDKARKSIGKQLGDAVDELSKTVNVPMESAYKTLDDILKEIDILPIEVNNKIKLDFSMAGLSKAQKNKVTELYELAREGGKTLTPRQLYNKDKLFSQLSREARISEIGDILVMLPNAEKPQSLFSIFKDVYSKTLDEVSPQNIRALNLEYRKYRTMVDIIEDTLLKGGKKLNNAMLIKKDPTEFAKVNLRRIYGESASSAEFSAVADAMDDLARSLGYTDATPADIANFANELRKLYPETIPKTGFRGGIKAGVGDVVDTALSIGKPTVKDQREALKKLVESLLK